MLEKLQPLVWNDRPGGFEKDFVNQLDISLSYAVELSEMSSRWQNLRLTRKVSQIEQLWRVNSDLGRIENISTGNVTCINAARVSYIG